ncbi:hypothetical protein BDW62DRAFT_194188 [Aspergillus aurantiobrunneus]
MGAKVVYSLVVVLYWLSSNRGSCRKPCCSRNRGSYYCPKWFLFIGRQLKVPGSDFAKVPLVPLLNQYISY